MIAFFPFTLTESSSRERGPCFRFYLAKEGKKQNAQQQRPAAAKTVLGNGPLPSTWERRPLLRLRNWVSRVASFNLSLLFWYERAIWLMHPPEATYKMSKKSFLLSLKDWAWAKLQLMIRPET